MPELYRGMPEMTPHCKMVRRPDGSETLEAFDSSLDLSVGAEATLDGEKVIVSRIIPDECVPMQVWKK